MIAFTVSYAHDTFALGRRRQRGWRRYPRIVAGACISVCIRRSYGINRSYGLDRVDRFYCNPVVLSRLWSRRFDVDFRAGYHALGRGGFFVHVNKAVGGVDVQFFEIGGKVVIAVFPPVASAGIGMDIVLQSFIGEKAVAHVVLLVVGIVTARKGSRRRAIW